MATACFLCQLRSGNAVATLSPTMSVPLADHFHGRQSRQVRIKAHIWHPFIASLRLVRDYGCAWKWAMLL
jgi:hypothetical protein